jgi:hypothetical protein
VVTNLTDGSKQARAYSVMPFGNDIYAVGTQDASNNSITLWKNGTPTIISNPNFKGNDNRTYLFVTKKQ